MAAPNEVKLRLHDEETDVERDAPSALRPSPASHPATWRPLIDAACNVAKRSVTVASRVTAPVEHWERAAGNRLLYPLRLRTSLASDHDAAIFSAHTTPVDLALHSSYFEQLLNYPEEGCFSDTRQLGAMVLGLDLPQELLHSVVRALYAGAIELGPGNVEQVLQVAQFLGMEVLQRACADYLLRDCIAAAAAAASVDRSAAVLSLSAPAAGAFGAAPDYRAPPDPALWITFGPPPAAPAAPFLGEPAFGAAPAAPFLGVPAFGATPAAPFLGAPAFGAAPAASGKPSAAPAVSVAAPEAAARQQLAVQIAQLACVYCTWMLPGLLDKLAEQLPWSCQPLHTILGSVLAESDAAALISKKRTADPCVCEMQVCDCRALELPLAGAATGLRWQLHGLWSGGMLGRLRAARGAALPLTCCRPAGAGLR
jgi:hypothetical protein